MFIAFFLSHNYRGAVHRGALQSKYRSKLLHTYTTYLYRNISSIITTLQSNRTLYLETIALVCLSRELCHCLNMNGSCLATATYTQQARVSIAGLRETIWAGNKVAGKRELQKEEDQGQTVVERILAKQKAKVMSQKYTLTVPSIISSFTATIVESLK